MRKAWLEAIVFSLILAVSFGCAPARAGLFGDMTEVVELATKASLRMAKNSAVSAAARKAGRTATLVLNHEGKLQLTKLAAGATATTLVIKNGDDIAKYAQDLAGKIFITPEVLTEHANQLKSLLVGKTEIEIVSTDTSENAALELQPHFSGDGSTLVIRKSDKLKFSTAAWEKRGLLKQPLMADLIKRLKIIVIVPQTHVVQRLEFSKSFGFVVDFADDAATFASWTKEPFLHS